VDVETVLTRLQTSERSINDNRGVFVFLSELDGTSDIVTLENSDSVNHF
jgi:hypothetical protein